MQNGTNPPRDTRCVQRKGGGDAYSQCRVSTTKENKKAVRLDLSEETDLGTDTIQYTTCNTRVATRFILEPFVTL